MKTTGGMLAIVLLAACAQATIDFFFWYSNWPYPEQFGLKTPSLVTRATNGNGRDFRDGYELVPPGGPYAVPPYAEPGFMQHVFIMYGSPWPQWVYIWGRFNNEPSYEEVGRLAGIAININGASTGMDSIAYYLCDNTDEPNIHKKRWDGDLEYFYSNPTALISIFSAGIRNKPADEPWNLYVGGAHRAFLLGAVRVPEHCFELTIEVSAIGYAGGSNPNPPAPQVRYLNKVVIPEPTGLLLLPAVGLAARRR